MPCIASSNISDLGYLYFEDVAVEQPVLVVSSSLVFSDASVSPTANLTRLTSGETARDDNDGGSCPGSEVDISSSLTSNPEEGKRDHILCKDDGDRSFFGRTPDTLGSFVATELEETV